MRRQRWAFFVGPTFLGVQDFEGSAQYVLNARISATGEAFVDQCLDVGRDVQLHACFSILVFIIAIQAMRAVRLRVDGMTVSTSY
jgi:hypothetical protein